MLCFRRRPGTPADESEIDLRAITDVSFDGIAIIQDGRVLYANIGFLEGAALVRQLFALKRQQPPIVQVMSLNSAVQSVRRTLRALVVGPYMQTRFRFSRSS